MTTPSLPFISFRWLLGGLMLTASCLLTPGRAQLLWDQIALWQGTTQEVLTRNVPYPLSATASSGLPLTLRVSFGPATLVDGILTVTGDGMVQVTAEQAGNETYAPLRTTRTFNIQHARITQVGEVANTFVSRVQVMENLAYVVGGMNLLLFDVGDPAIPVLVGHADTAGSAYGLHVVGHYAFVAVRDAGLQIFDVSNPANPVAVGLVDTPGSAEDVAVAGKYAYVVDAGKGLQVIDVSNPSVPVLVSTVLTPSHAYRVRISGNTAYMGREIIDVTDPINPVRSSVFSTSEIHWNESEPLDLRLAGSTAYIITADFKLSGAEPSFSIMDVSQTFGPTLIGTTPIRVYPWGVQIDGVHAFVAGAEGGLEVIDITNLSSPVPVGLYDTAARAIDVDVKGSLIFVADLEGLRIVHVEYGFPSRVAFDPPPEVPIRTGSFTLPLISSAGLPVTYEVLGGPAKVEGDRLVLQGLWDPLESTCRHASLSIL